MKMSNVRGVSSGVERELCERVFMRSVRYGVET